MRILIAEDDPVSRRLLEVTLTGWGYEVQVTCDGRTACQALEVADPPPLALLDWMLPEMDMGLSTFDCQHQEVHTVQQASDRLQKLGINLTDVSIDEGDEEEEAA